MSDPQGTPANDPWAPQSPSQQNPAQGSVPSTPQVPQAAEAAQPAQQPWGAPQAPAQPEQAQPQQPWDAPQAQPAQPQQPWGAPQPQPAQPQQQWGAAPQPAAAWQGAQGQGGTAWTVAQPGIIPLRPLTVGEILTGAFQAVRVNPQTMFGFAFAVMAVVALVETIFTAISIQALTNSIMSGSFSVYSMISSFSGTLVSSLFSFVGTTFLAGMLALTVWDAVLGRKSTPADAWNRFSPRIVPVLLATLLLAAIQFGVTLVIIIVFFLLIGLVGAGTAGYAYGGDYGSAMASAGSIGLLSFLMFITLLCVVGFLSVKFAFISLAVILEGLGPVDALKRSWNLSKGSFWRVLGRLIIIGLVVGVIGMVLGAIIGAILGVGASLSTAMTTSLISSFLTTLVSAVIIPVQSSYQTLMYLDERMRKENLAPMIAEEAARI